MDDPEETPLFFANQVIHKFVDNMLGRGIDSKQCQVIRVVFRRCGGQWFRVVGGDPVHIGLLIRLIKGWGEAQAKDKAKGESDG
jgi:hypothetical protein